MEGSGPGKCIDLFMRVRENIVMLTYCKFRVNIKMLRIENIKKFEKDINLWKAFTHRRPMINR